MYRITAFLLLVFPPLLSAGQSLITTTVPVAMRLPAEAPYNALGSSRLELWLTDIKPCVAGPAGNSRYVTNWVRIGATNGTLFALGCNAPGEWGIVATLGSAGEPTTLLSAQQAANRTDLIIRMQKDQENGRFTFETWSPEGGAPIARTVITAYSLYKSQTVVTPNQPAFILGNGTIGIAWMRWYSGAVPLNSAMPKNNGAPGDLGNWEFEGTLDGTRATADGRMEPLNLSRSSAECPEFGCFANSPVPAPVVQAKVVNARAGEVMTLDASDSFTFDDSNLSSFSWSWVSGPAEPVITGSDGPNPSVSRLVAGTHVFRLSATDAAGRELAPVFRTIHVDNLDLDGFQILPSNTAISETSVDVALDSVSNAASADVIVRKPDGRSFPPVSCGGGSCTVKVDPRQGDHSVRFQYKDSSGNVIQDSDWQVLPVAKTAVDGPFGTESYGKKGHQIIYGAYGYHLGPPGAPNGPVAIFPSVAKFSSRYLKAAWGGPSFKPYAVQPMMMTRYIDWAVVMPDMMFRSIANSPVLGDDYEDAYVHQSRNYEVRRYGAGDSSPTAYSPAGAGNPNFYWDGMESFAQGEGANGVVLATSAPCPAQCADRSTEAYNSAPGDVAVTDKMLIGYWEPFDEVNFDFTGGTLASGSTVTWEYWSSGGGISGEGWKPLTGIYLQEPAGCSSLSVALNNRCRVRFIPPADWARSVQSGRYRKWWIRIGVSGGVTPVLSRITGDDWRQPEMPVQADQDTKIWPYVYLAAADRQKFGSMTFEVASIASQPTSWEYWNGLTWVELPIAPDATNALRRTGTNSINFDPPFDWQPRSYYGSDVRYWLRTKSAVTVPAVVRGITINATAAMMAATGRGWNSTDVNRVNVGLGPLEYNPNPPANALARFRYQSRMVSIWGPNRAIGRKTAKRDGYCVWAIALLGEAKTIINENFNALFLDDLGTMPGNEVSPGQWTTFSDAKEQQEANNDCLGDMRTLFHQNFPGNYYFGGNGPALKMLPNLDFFLHEGFWDHTVMHSLYSPTVTQMHLLPGLKTIGAYTFSDPAAVPVVGPNQDQPVPWSRATRGPITALANYYIGANENTLFLYERDSAAGNYYTTIDVLYHEKEPEYFLSADTGFPAGEVCSEGFRSLSGNHLLSIAGIDEINTTKQGSNNPDCLRIQYTRVSQNWPSGTPVFEVKRCYFGVECNPPLNQVSSWGALFPALGIDVGVPETEKNLQWKTPAQAGTRFNVWMRKYTKAIILHIPGHAASMTPFDITGDAGYIDFYADGLCDSPGCVLYPLRADGLTSNEMCPAESRTASGGCTGIVPKRASEGWILMKEPVY